LSQTDDRPLLPHISPVSRYEDLGFIRPGGETELRRVRDRELDRIVAMRVLHAAMLNDVAAVRRFVDSVRIHASLEHPGILPIHEIGRLKDGRYFATMPDNKGLPIAEVVGAGTLRVAVRTFAKALEALSYAHDRHIVHGALSPDTIRVGGRGQVVVVDWGTADETDPRVDVMALGLTLRAIAQDRRNAGVEGEVLAAICAKATHAELDERYPDAASLLAVIESWMDQSPRQARALQMVESAEALNPQAREMRKRANDLNTEADSIMSKVEPWDTEQKKELGWAKQEQAALFDREADRIDSEAERMLYSAFNHAPDLGAAHRALAARYRAQHEAAEADRDAKAAERAGALLRVHSGALSSSSPVRKMHFAYLKGLGSLSLVTDPPGADVELHRYETHNRRQVWVAERSLGRTPLANVPLTMGSYLLVIRAKGRVPVRYPVLIRRQEHWDGVPPNEHHAKPIYLPRVGELRKNDCYVPAGWFWAGGDAEALDAAPRKRLWADGFALRRFPVTNREYLAFLNDLVHTNREDDAKRFVPRERNRLPGKRAGMIYARRRDGTFYLRKDIDGDRWLKDWPVFMTDWACARGFAAWFAEVTGQPWRVPSEYEWEKAARGADERLFPWGDWLDPSWTRTRDSRAGRMYPAVVGRHPVDVSPYGVRGLGGNVRDWCFEGYKTEGPDTPGDRVIVQEYYGPREPAWSTERVARGGYWAMSAQGSRAATRYHVDAHMRSAHLGMRMARSIG